MTESQRITSDTRNEKGQRVVHVEMTMDIGPHEQCLNNAIRRLNGAVEQYEKYIKKLDAYIQTGEITSQGLLDLLDVDSPPLFDKLIDTLRTYHK